MAKTTDTPCGVWVSCEEHQPIAEDLVCFPFSRSIDVLFTDGEGQWVGYLLARKDTHRLSWHIEGDGREVKRVTHWMRLPSLPAGSETNTRTQ